MRAPRNWLLAAIALVVALALTVLALVLVAFLSGSRSPTVRVKPQVTFALPPPSRGCDGARPVAGGGEKIPLTVSAVAGQVAETLEVCIEGKGPYPFVLDTGAGQSTIDAGLARRLHLPSAGFPSSFAGVGCTGTARPVSVSSWSLDGIPLTAQQLTAATLPQIGGKGEPDGLIGSDVLSRFGAVRVDFVAGALVVPGTEGAPLSASAPYRGPTGGPPPVTLTRGQGTTVPVTVTPQPGDVSVAAQVRFGRSAPRSFVVDTGSSQSVVSNALARAESLEPTHLAERQSTVCSVITVPLVHSGPWSIPGVSLHPQLVGATDFGTISLNGTQGLLGSDQLRHYGWVVFDYVGARMVLG